MKVSQTIYVSYVTKYYRLVCGWVALLCLGIFPLTADAQLMINKGASIQTKVGSIVQVNGAYQNQSGTIQDSGSVTVTTDFTNNSGAFAGGAGIYHIGGNFTDDGSFNQETGTVDLNGSTNQNVGGTTITTFYDLQFNGGGSKTLTQKEIVDSNCYFTNGSCFTTQAFVLHFTTKGNWVNNSSMPNAANISHVEGPVEKDMNSTNEFWFPVGKKSNANTCAITPASATATTFRTEYFKNKYVNTTSVISPLVSPVSGIHYWHADIVSGGPNNGILKLWWVPGDYTALQMPTPSSLVVARWNIGLSAWESAGNSAEMVGATYNFGWIKSNTIVSANFGTSSTNQPFTLASTTADNTLPVELGGFTAKQVANHVVLDWYTYSEINNLGFEIERRRVGGDPVKIKSFDNDTALEAKSQFGASYETFDDEGLATGRYLYELFQTDQNGIRTRVASRYLDFTELNIPTANSISVYPNPASESSTLDLLLDQDEHVFAQIFDVSGRMVATIADLDMSAGEHLVAFDVTNLSSGAYTVQVIAGSDRITRSIIVRR